MFKQETTAPIVNNSSEVARRPIGFRVQNFVEEGIICHSSPTETVIPTVENKYLSAIFLIFQEFLEDERLFCYTSEERMLEKIKAAKILYSKDRADIRDFIKPLNK